MNALPKVNHRTSNIELLRIISMFAILFFHGIHLGFLNIEGLERINTRIFNIALWGLFWHVDVFVLISGYFGINFKWEKIAKLSAYILSYVILIDIFVGGYGLKEIVKSIYGLVSDGYMYWFIMPYVILYMTSPILNLVNKLSNKDFNKIVLLLTITNIIFGFFIKNGYNINGFNANNFIYLYLLGMGVKRYKDKLTINRYFLALTFILNILLLYILSFKVLSFDYCFAYNNPLVICNAIIVFILFDRFNIKNKFINAIASSTLAVYLITDNGYLTRKYIVEITNLIYAYTHDPVIDLLMWLAISIVIFASCVIFDKIITNITSIIKHYPPK